MTTTNDAAPERPGDRAADLRVLLTASGVIGAGFGWGASLQSWWIYSALVPEWAQVDLWRRLLANGVAVAALVVALWLMHVHTARRYDDIAVRLVAAAIAMSLLRVTLQSLLGVYGEGDEQALQAEFLSGAAIALVASSIGAGAMLASRRARGRTRAAERTAMSVEPAMIPPQSVPLLTSVNVESQSGRVRRSSRVITTSASVNSFQAWMNPKTPVATRPGASSGKVTRKNACGREQPSIIAASSSS